MAENLQNPSARMIAKLLLISERHVQRLAKEGVIPRAEGGGYPLVGAVQGYIKHLRAQLEGDGDFERHRSKLYGLRAALAEIELKRQQGLLVPLGAVGRAWAYLVTALRARMLSIPTKLAASLASLSDPREIRAALQQEIHEALEKLSNDDALAARASRDDSRGAGNGEAATPSDSNRVG